MGLAAAPRDLREEDEGEHAAVADDDRRRRGVRELTIHAVERVRGIVGDLGVLPVSVGALVELLDRVADLLEPLLVGLEELLGGQVEDGAAELHDLGRDVLIDGHQERGHLRQVEVAAAEVERGRRGRRRRWRRRAAVVVALEAAVELAPRLRGRRDPVAHVEIVAERLETVDDLLPGERAERWVVARVVRLAAALQRDARRADEHGDVVDDVERVVLLADVLLARRLAEFPALLREGIERGGLDARLEIGARAIRDAGDLARQQGVVDGEAEVLPIEAVLIAIRIRHRDGGRKAGVRRVHRVAVDGAGSALEEIEPLGGIVEEVLVLVLAADLDVEVGAVGDRLVHVLIPLLKLPLEASACWHPIPHLAAVLLDGVHAGSQKDEKDQDGGKHRGGGRRSPHGIAPGGHELAQSRLANRAGVNGLLRQDQDEDRDDDNHHNAADGEADDGSTGKILAVFGWQRVICSRGWCRGLGSRRHRRKLGHGGSPPHAAKRVKGGR
mmetsp:Transcript_492/g.1261  ORF Transcript_492/g.1261 Transcript_492/m.1261 type:complete len:500 (-) Transcript_492:14-1513(-)